MKKVLAMLCAGVCAIGMTACGDEENYMTPIIELIDGVNQGDGNKVFRAMYSDEFLKKTSGMYDEEDIAKVVEMLELEIEEVQGDFSSEYGSTKLVFKKLEAEKFDSEELDELKEVIRDETGAEGVAEAYHVYVSLYAGDNLIESNLDAATVKIGDSWMTLPDNELLEFIF